MPPTSGGLRTMARVLASRSLFVATFLFAIALALGLALSPGVALPPPSAAPLPPLPADTIGFLHLKVGEVWALAPVQNAMKQLKPEVATRISREFTRGLGLETAD